MKYEMPKIDICYFDNIYTDEIDPLTGSKITNAAITGNQYVENGANVAAARTARVQTIIKLNRPQN